jgi:hypothetical protein|tara:strand:+ start:769 stop:1503 length:735 start_codon:yes stop_codon:yes gene_type:complete
MINKIITFSTEKSYFKQKDLYPEPCKLNIPDWFKKLDHTAELMTVKGCMPFLDSLTSGYLLKIPADLYLKHNYSDENGRYTTIHSKVPNIPIMKLNVNKEGDEQLHPPQQLGNECPFHKKNQGLSYQKILNPWLIKTPPGYSCLFLPPMNNGDDRFSIIPGIVDTDSFISEINFPIIVNGDKYPMLETIIKKGTPYVQVIPFKRESWKMEVTSNEENRIERIFYQQFKFLHNYKTRWWNKKSWK